MAGDNPTPSMSWVSISLPILTSSFFSSPFLSLLSSPSCQFSPWSSKSSVSGPSCLRNAGSVPLIGYLLFQLPWISQRLLVDTFPPEPFFMLQPQDSTACTSKEFRWTPCFLHSTRNKCYKMEVHLSLPLLQAFFSLQHISIAECLHSLPSFNSPPSSVTDTWVVPFQKTLFSSHDANGPCLAKSEPL